MVRHGIPIVLLLTWFVCHALLMASIAGAMHFSPSALVLLTLIWVIAIAISLPYVVRAITFGEALAADQDKITEIVETGAPLLQFRASGQIAWISGRLASMSVTGYPGGLVISALILREVGLRRTEILRICRGKYFLSASIEVHHNSREIGSPVRLVVGDAAAIEGRLHEIYPA